MNTDRIKGNSVRNLQFFKGWTSWKIDPHEINNSIVV